MQAGTRLADDFRVEVHDLIQRKQAVVRVAGPLPPVAGDPERVMQLLANLFANALKYNPGGRPEAVLGALPDGAGSGTVRHGSRTLATLAGQRDVVFEWHDACGQ